MAKAKDNKKKDWNFYKVSSLMEYFALATILLGQSFVSNEVVRIGFISVGAVWLWMRVSAYWGLRAKKET